MPRSTGTRAAAVLCELLRERRHARGLTQVDVARQLHRPQSFVSKYETGERRLDLVELSEVCDALDLDLVSLIDDFQRRLDPGRAGRRR